MGGRQGQQRLTLFAVLLTLVSSIFWTTGCLKVPITDINTDFRLADVTWFEGEDTLFVFYEVFADQALADNNQIEIAFDTESAQVDWTPLDAFPAVHDHIPVDCGANTKCGSTSLTLREPPRNVRLRLRYDPDGDVALDAPVAYNRVGPGTPFENRSLLVYGVFDADNRRVQWRSRHRFPTLRNADVDRLGLRRRFVIEDQTSGEAFWNLSGGPNPYGYSLPCPEGFASVGISPVETRTRAIFNPVDLPQTSMATTGSAPVQRS